MPAQAQSLSAILQKSLTADPQIQIARADVRSAEAGVEIARADRLPSLLGNAHALFQISNASTYQQRTSQIGGDIEFSLPIYSGGEIKYRIRAARSFREEREAAYDDVVNARLAETASRYAGLARDRDIEQATRNQVSIVASDLEATIARLSGGDVTKTDVQQATARLAASRASLARARSALTGSEENIREITGVYVNDADWPEPPNVSSVMGDLATDLPKAPQLMAAVARVARAIDDVQVARSQRLPRLSFTTAFERANDLDNTTLSSRHPFRNAVRLGFTLSVPLYQGGVVSARVRQAEAFVGMRRSQQAEIERELVATIRSRYAQLQSANLRIESTQAALQAAREAALDVEAESTVGTRTRLDVLNARQEVLQNEIAMAGARSDRVALAYSILALMGRLPDVLTTPSAPHPAAAAALTSRPVLNREGHTKIASYPVDKLGLWVWKGSTTWSLNNCVAHNPVAVDAPSRRAVAASRA